MALQICLEPVKFRFGQMCMSLAHVCPMEAVEDCFACPGADIIASSRTTGLFHVPCRFRISHSTKTLSHPRCFSMNARVFSTKPDGFSSAR